MPEQQPLVTVVTVTYNSSAYVRDAINGVLAQTYRNFEYIILDDHSTDDTWDVISSYSDPRIRAERNEQNLREYPNRNKAIGMARGEYLIFIDGDDIIYPNGIEFFVSQMQEHPSACMAIQKNYLNNLLYPVLLSPEQVITNHYFGSSDLLSSSFCSNFFRTSKLREAGGLKDDLVCGDDEVRVRLAARHPVLFVAGWVSWPRETPGQASSKVTEATRMKERGEYTRALLVETPAGIMDTSLRRDIAAMLRYRESRYCLKLLSSGNISSYMKSMNEFKLGFSDLLTTARRRPMRNDFLHGRTGADPFRMTKI